MRCPYCHDAIADSGWVVCVTCLARHHEPCFAEAGCCASCKGREALDPSLAQRYATPDEKAVAKISSRRKALRMAAIVLGGILVDTALALGNGYTPRLWYAVPLMIGGAAAIVAAVVAATFLAVFVVALGIKAYGTLRKKLVREPDPVREPESSAKDVKKIVRA